MKNILLFLILILALNNKLNSQEKFGHTLNVGAGIGTYAYAPAATVNYEFDVFKNFTLAPFVSVLSYRNYRYWGDPHNNYPYRNYYYRQTIVPIGVKGSYYFDNLLKASPKWDFYAAASLGFAYTTTSWENGYYGDRVVSQYTSGLYGNLHIGTEYHFNDRVGAFLDLSTGMSSLGLGFHL